MCLEGESRTTLQLAELDAIYRAAPVGLAALDRSLRYVRVNELLARMNGRTVEEHVGRAVAEIAAWEGT